jgi:DNA-binding IclR family transcriptional regulator
MLQMANSSNTHKAVDKALNLLLSFVPENKAAGTTELSERLDMHKSTVNRLLHVLNHFDLLQQDPQTKKFSLGKAIDDLAKALHRSYDSRLLTSAQPHIDTLSQGVRETAVLEVLSGNSTVLLYAAEGPGPIFIREAAGERRPVHASAGGKLLLAFSPPKVRERYLKGHLRAVTPNTITDRPILNKHFKTIMKQGYALDNEEVHLGIRAVGAPIFDKNKRIMAAVVITGLAPNIDIEGPSEVITQVMRTAATISSEL